ncbi:heavy metal-binding protein HIP-like [Crassostrea virginica]
MSSNIPLAEATSNHVMVFDLVKTNAGNGYHPSTGVFIVPKSGIYVFSWSFRNSDRHYHSTELMVNNSVESIIHLHSAAGIWISGTGVAVLHVNKGDDVYVRISALGH